MSTILPERRTGHALESCEAIFSSSRYLWQIRSYLMNSLLDGVGFEEIIEGIHVKRIRKKADQIKESIRGSIDIIQVILIRGSLEQIDFIQKRIDELDKEIKSRVASRKEDLRIAMPFQE
jgi:hypothetical protein